MSSRYPAAWLDELRSRSDIVQIVSGYVALNKKGRKYWGLCPFHGEKTPSFSVDGEHQLYYCFGCKAGGNVFHFFMEMEHCTFNEAVEQLAERAHMTLPELEKDEDYERRRTQRERLLNANKEAARFYHETLFTPAGAASLAYLRKRGLSDGIIRKFGLGASPDDWCTLSNRLMEKGFTLDELVLAGLTVRKKAENGKERYFDMFRSRAMFPIIDAYGNVLAFGGRTLEKREPKYLNTADTPVFNKRKGVFAANLLRQQRHLDRVILVEGYMDVVSLTQFGVEGVCATLGTALTAEQARLLKRYAPQVYLGYDGDSAGQHAILRGLEILEQENVPARVLDFPDGLDPDEFIRRDGAEGFRKLPAISPAAYRLRRLKDGFDLSAQDSRLAYARGASEIVSSVDPLERDVLLGQLSVETGFSRETLLEQMNLSAQKAAARPKDQPARPRPPRPPVSAQPQGDDLRAQELLLSLFASGQIPKDMIEEKDFDDDELKSLYRELAAGTSPASLPDLAPDEASRSRYTRLLLTPTAGSTDEMIAMANDCLIRIRKTSLEKRYDELSQEISSASGEQLSALLQEAREISDKLKKLK
ncbi:MAG: DNA primase [Clostridiales bacterium]|nr:DNA primase [Clostridiales bacterium]